MHRDGSIRLRKAKGMIAQSWDKAEHVDTWGRAKRRAAKAGGWRVRSMSRWKLICDGRGGEEGVIEIGRMRRNTTDGGSIGQMGTIKITRKNG